MYSLRKWFYRPKKEDTSKLAMFYWADEELTVVATELDSFDGRTDPDRCSILVTQLRLCQDKVLSICNEIMDEAIPDMRANRDFRAKFPDDVLHENLAGQLWFGAECLAAGSNIIHRELESASMRPLAKALTRALDNVRCLLRAQSLKNSQEYSDKVKEALRIFDRLFAEFELAYVSAMVPIKSAKEYHLQQEIVVLFSETLIRGLHQGLIEQEMVDDYDPSLMFTIPRLAIVWGLLIFPDGPFNVDRDAEDMSELFRPFCSLLLKIRDLLWTLTRSELSTLEKMLCSQEEPKLEEKPDNQDVQEDVFNNTEEYINKFCQNHSSCKQFVQDFYLYNFGMPPDGAGGNQEGANEEINASIRESTHSKTNLRLRNIHNRQGYALLSNPQEPEYDDDIVTAGVGSSDCSSFTRLSCVAQNVNRGVPPQDCSVFKGSGAGSGSVQNCICEGMQTELPAFCEASSSCRHSRKYGSCSVCTGAVESLLPPSSPSGALSLECRLSQLHNHCNCGLADSPAGRRHGPSRTLMRQVMSRVEIVPPGHQINGYSSSPEGSPRAYHHGLLSRSFPAHHEYADVRSASGSPYVPTASSFKRRCGLPKQRSHSMKIDCDISPSRLHSASPGKTSLRSYRNSSNKSTPLPIPVQCIEEKNCDASYSSCSSCQSISSVSSPELNSTSPETSSYNSECQDDEEIALALQAAEIASRNRARARFKNSKDLLHKLFVCISGVADQLQTNYASDLRNILKSVFDMNCSQNLESSCNGSTVSNDSSHWNELADGDVAYGEAEMNEGCENTAGESSSPSKETVRSIKLIPESEDTPESPGDDDRDRSSVDSAEEAVPDSPTSLVITDIVEESDSPGSEYDAGPPAWVPDDMSSHCMACEMPFTLLRRRHHCRNCGKIFCSRCSSNSIPLPRFGHLKPVRVCNQCFMYQLTSLVIQQQQS